MSERSVHVEGQAAGGQSELSMGETPLGEYLDFFLPSRNPLLMNNLMNYCMRMGGV